MGPCIALHERGPRHASAGAQGYGLNTPSTDTFVGFSFPHHAAVGDSGCEDRISVTGNHLTFDGTTVSTAELQLRSDGGRSNGVQPSLSSTFSSLVPSADVGAHATSWPRACAADPCCIRRSPKTCTGPTCGALTWNYVKVLSCTCRVTCGEWFHRSYRASREKFRALLRRSAWYVSVFT